MSCNYELILRMILQRWRNGKRKNLHLTSLLERAQLEECKNKKKLANVAYCCFFFFFFFLNEERSLVCVPAGVVLLQRTQPSALPLRLVINGYRFITSSQSAMLTVRPTLLVTLRPIDTYARMLKMNTKCLT